MPIINLSNKYNIKKIIIKNNQNNTNNNNDMKDNFDNEKFIKEQLKYNPYYFT